MISLSKLYLNESEASEKAKQMGLDYMSFGRWGKDGKVTHKSEKGKLVPVKHNKLKDKTKKPKQNRTKDQLKKSDANSSTVVSEPTHNTETYVSDVTSKILQVLQNRNPSEIVNVVVNSLNRTSPVKVKILDTDESPDIGVMGMYNPKKDQVDLFFTDYGLERLFESEPSSWRSSDANKFNTMFHEAIHASSPRLKNMFLKGKVPGIYVALEEGITEYIAKEITKKIQVDDGIARGKHVDDPHEGESDYDITAESFGLMKEHSGLNPVKLFTHTNDEEELSSIVDKHGRDTIKTIASKVFSPKEVDAIMKEVETSISPEQKKFGIRGGHSIMSREVNKFLKSCLNPANANLSSERKESLLMWQLDMDSDGIDRVLGLNNER